jgi:hypothetical protein
VPVQFRCRHVAGRERCVLTQTKGLWSGLGCIAPGMDLSAKKGLRHTRLSDAYKINMVFEPLMALCLRTQPTCK